jgi:hypothetical protein
VKEFSTKIGRSWKIFSSSAADKIGGCRKGPQQSFNDTERQPAGAILQERREDIPLSRAVCEMHSRPKLSS